MKKEDPQSIGDILSRFMNSQNIAIAAAEGSAREIWCKVVGEYIADATCDAFIKDGILTVSFSKSSVKTEVLMHRKTYIEAMNRELGRKIIRSIRLL